MFSFIFNALIGYIKKHPEVLEKLVEEAVQAVIHQLVDHNTTKAAAISTATTNLPAPPVT